jgi:hypothetical protein
MATVGTAELLALAWTCSLLLGSRVLPRIFGSMQVAGAPRWRSVSSLGTQWVIFPWCYFHGAEVGERLFIYVFTLYMLLDFVVVKLDALLIVHHIFCLLGHALVCVYEPIGLPMYFAGVVALEMGSGSMNQYCVYPGWVGGAILYAVGMSVSNVVALYFAYRWCLLPLSPWTKLLNMAITVVMVFLRQKSCRKYIKHGPYTSH